MRPVSIESASYIKLPHILICVMHMKIMNDAMHNFFWVLVFLDPYPRP